MSRRGNSHAGFSTNHGHSAAIKKPVPASAVEVADIRKRVLVMDTQMGVRTLVSTVLERDGFNVVLTCNPDEALAAGFVQFERLVTATDLEQPLDGVDLFRTLRALHPDIQITYRTQREFLASPRLTISCDGRCEKRLTVHERRGRCVIWMRHQDAARAH